MTRGAGAGHMAAEIVWLLVSTALFVAAAIQEAGGWRVAWVLLLVINVAVSGLRLARSARHLRAGGSAA